MRLARKELAILAISISLEGNPRKLRLSIYLTTIFSLSLVRFIILGVRSAYKGCPARRRLSIIRFTLKIAATRRIERFASYLRA